MSIKVYKFGGASINSIDRIKNTAEIIRNTDGQCLVVISAMGKTTNALEKVVMAYFDGRHEEALGLFEAVKQNHLTTLKYLVVKFALEAEQRLKDLFTEIEWMLHDKPVRNYDYYYDQIVCIGELLSSTILSYFLKEENVPNQWIDVRDILRTDDNFRDAAVDWEVTTQKSNEQLTSALEAHKIVIIQGFIGATDENESTTLGREGSDYTAAIFAKILSAGSVTIWKDVEAVMNADPKQFSDAVNIAALSYTEVIEMAYYGAQVIHPKTIKPLQNSNIPLFVKSFLDPALEGTVINNKVPKQMPPVIVLKQDQVLMKFRTLDFSFVEEKPTGQLHSIFKEARIKSNLSQHTAISLLYCFDDHSEKIGQVAAGAAELFDVEVEKGLTLLTIRHYNEDLIKALTLGKQIVLEQKTPDTVQVVMRQ